MNQIYRKKNIVKMLLNDDWMEINDGIKTDGEVHLKRLIADNSEITKVAINEIEEVRVTMQDWRTEQFWHLFEFHGDDIDYLSKKLCPVKEFKNEGEKINCIKHNLKERKYTDDEIGHLIQSLYDRGTYKEPFDPKILLKGCELKGLKNALKDGQYFFLNRLQNYLEDHPNLKEVDISSIPNLINKPKFK
jgi:hypothetical protein